MLMLPKRSTWQLLMVYKCWSFYRTFCLYLFHSETLFASERKKLESKLNGTAEVVFYVIAVLKSFRKQKNTGSWQRCMPQEEGGICIHLSPAANREKWLQTARFLVGHWPCVKVVGKHKLTSMSPKFWSCEVHPGMKITFGQGNTVVSPSTSIN